MKRKRRPKTRLGREVRDAKQSLVMPLTKGDIAAAKRKRRKYQLNDPDNFSECVLATCVAKIADAEVIIMRRHAYLALPDDQYTLRYEIGAATGELIRLNDEGRFGEIPANVNMVLKAPSPRRRLATMRANWHRKGKDQYQRGSGRKQRPPDPLHARNGIHA